MYYVPGFSNYLQRRFARGGTVSEDEPEATPLNATPLEQLAYSLSAGQPVYGLPAEQPLYSAPVEQQPLYSAPVEQSPYAAPVEQQPLYSAPVEQQQPLYSAPVEQSPYAAPVEQQPLYSAPVEQPLYSAPVEQPLYSAPVEQQQPLYSAPVEQQPLYSAPVEQSPYAAPVEQTTPAPVAAPVDLGDWSLSNFQNQFMQPGGANALADYVGEQAAQGNNYVSPIGDPLTNSVLMPGAQTNLLNLYGKTPEEQALRYFRFQGRDDTGDTATPIVMRDEYTGGYRLVNDETGEVMGTANSPEELQGLLTRAGGMRGAKDAYSLQALTPEGRVLDTLYQQKPKETLGDLLVQMGALALPAAGGAALGPVLSGALGSSAAVGTGVGTALGSALSGVTAGKSLGDILKQAAISGITAGGLQALAGGPSAAGSEVGGLAADLQTKVIDGALSVADASKMLANAGATSAQIAKFAADATGSFASTVPTVFGNVANAASNLSTAAGGIAGGALSGLIGAPGTTVTGSVNPAKSNLPEPALTSAIGGLPTPAEQPMGGLEIGDPNSIVVSSAPNAAVEAAGGALSTIAPVLAQTAGPEPRRADYGDKVEEEPAATVVGQKPVDLPPIGGAPSGSFQADFDATFPQDTIVARGVREPEITAPVLPPLSIGDIATLPPTTPPLTSVPNVNVPMQDIPKSGMSLSDIIDYLRLAGLGTSLIGSLFGGGGGQQGAKLPTTFGSGGTHPTFSAKLPGANIPGLGGGAGSGPRTAAELGQQGLSSTQDYYRYGYGPEQSFFNYVPQGAPNTSKAYTGYAKGGFAVEGPGDGREDKIPAMLSDGEYVIDAETVALLGNGSNKAGANMLDQFRVNVRKHKGRELARGGFSAKAKRPEHYLAGGRT